MTLPWCHDYPYDTHPGVMINYAEHHDCASSKFGGNKTTDSEKIVLCSIDIPITGQQKKFCYGA